ncbi:protein MODIFIER OF SNC1 11-like [Asparagus officinalis]|uniref:protein MODIFIER OF SNC1 11-like n=1 Tax=Asparagus officinalis TaxID=4686 RepID=UPI00098DE3B0|nr:protein MODIFIER OF SNC1 11-like [Asparagus officinalis]
MEKPQENLPEKALDPIPKPTATEPNPTQNPNPATIIIGGEDGRREERFEIEPGTLRSGWRSAVEEEKRRTRAERFGTATGFPLQGKNGGNLEEQKRKARAERFGLVVHSSADEEAKKKARLERFGQTQKPNTLEEDKKKARAERFSQTSSTNGKKTTSEVKTSTEAPQDEPKSQ